MGFIHIVCCTEPTETQPEVEATEAPESTQIGIVFGVVLGTLLASLPVMDIVAISIHLANGGKLPGTRPKRL